MSAYYNENDPHKVLWLRELIKRGLIAPGDVDPRSICDVQPEDLKGYAQCHFFAGIGVWSYALRLAGWPDDREVWTGSCPCQSFSVAGKKKGFADERHLWPAWFRLIAERRPAVIFGEQSSSKDALAWIDLVSDNLEAEDYAVGALDTCAAGVGAPHIRQRLYFVAEPHGKQRNGGWNTGEGRRFEDSNLRVLDELGNTDCEGLARRSRQSGNNEPQQPSFERTSSAIGTERPGPTNGYWANADWIFCTDGKWRPVRPGSFPLVNGAPARVGRLRGYGDAIVVQLAAAFIEAYQEIEGS